MKASTPPSKPGSEHTLVNPGEYKICDLSSEESFKVVGLGTDVAVIVYAPHFGKAAIGRGFNEASMKAMFEAVTGGDPSTAPEGSLQVTLAGANVIPSKTAEATASVEATTGMLQMVDGERKHINIVHQDILKGTSGYDSYSYTPKSNTLAPYTLPLYAAGGMGGYGR